MSGKTAVIPIATLKNVHISLVIHPRKQEEDAPLTHASVFGTAKATQEADNLIILQKGKVNKYIEVKKNRFDGELGNIPLRFEKESNKFYELPVDTANPPLKKQAPVKAKDARSHMTEFPM